MKLSLGLLFVAGSLIASAALACDNFAGTYESTDPQIGKRIYTITQNGCEYKLQLNNAGAVVDPELVRKRSMKQFLM
ncbi:MAG: hypothetical protein KDD52_10245 [Bdellovibrionales bacterium]|nr:hypothetical protein [Bdellovibrionales bacterium]